MIHGSCGYEVACGDDDKGSDDPQCWFHGHNDDASGGMPQGLLLIGKVRRFTKIVKKAII